MAIDTQALFKTIDELATRRVASSSLDKTVVAEIVLQKDLDIGEYRVKYQDNIMSAFSTDVTLTYKIGQSVYMLIPGGDYSNKKIILGVSAQSAQTYNNKYELTNFFIDASPNWVGTPSWYNKIPILEICAVNAVNKHLLNKYHPFSNWKDYGFTRWQLLSFERWTTLIELIENLVNEINSNELMQGTTQTKAAYYRQNKQYRTTINNLLYSYIDELKSFNTDTPIEDYSKMPGTIMTPNQLMEADTHFQQFSKFANHIKISADFQTNFSSSHNVGTYTLRVECLEKNSKFLANDDPNKITSDLAIEPEYHIVSYDLTFNNFNGDPYQYSYPTHQQAFFPIDTNTLIGLYRVSLLQDGEIIPDYYYTYDDSGAEIINTALGEQGMRFENNNIQVTNIELKFANKVNLSDNLYYPWIETPYGVQLYQNQAEHLGTRTFVDLVAHLQYMDNDIALSDTAEIKWFIRDSSVTEATPEILDYDEYNMNWVDYSGPGWRPIELIQQQHPDWYRTDANVLTVRYGAIPWQTDYKVVIVYGKDRQVVESAQVTVYNADTPYDLTIEQFVGEDNQSTYLQVVNRNATVQNDYPWYAKWYVMGVDGAYYPLNNDAMTNQPLLIDNWALQPTVVFRAIAFDPMQVDPNHDGSVLLNFEPIGDLQKTLVNEKGKQLMINWRFFPETIDYDADGQLIHFKEHQSYFITPEVTWLGDFIGNWRIDIIDPQGNVLGPAYTNTDELFQRGRDIASSMMTDVYVDIDSTIHYTPRDQYDASKVGKQFNTFKAKITTSNGFEFIQDVTVQFTKDGGQGHTGSEWNVWIDLCTTEDDIDERVAPTDLYKRPIAYRRALQVEPYQEVVAAKEVVYQETSTYKQMLKTNGGTFTRLKQKNKTVNNKPLCIRPFIRKNGVLIEDYPSSYGYYYKTYWSVKYPKKSVNENTNQTYRSNLRLYHVDEDKSIFHTTTKNIAQTAYDFWNIGSKYNIQDYANRNYLTNEIDKIQSALFENNSDYDESINGLVAFSCFPSFKPSAGTKTVETYGAVEIKYHSNIDLNTHGVQTYKKYNDGTQSPTEIVNGVGDTVILDSNANFILNRNILDYYQVVTAIVEIYQGGNFEAGSFDYGGKKVATVTVDYPVEIFFDMNNVEAGQQLAIYNETYMYMNWLKEVSWKPSGAVPNNIILAKYCDADERDNVLLCRYTDNALNLNYIPIKTAYNYTKRWQTLEPEQEDIVYDWERQEYKPNTYYPYDETAVGVLMTRNPLIPIEDADWGKAYYVTNQIYYIDVWDNMAVNGWDGRSIELSEKQGTIFAPMVGAGYKTQTNGAFTGVIMGVNPAYNKIQYDESGNPITNPDDADYISYITDQDEQGHQGALAGIFGYQGGEASFGLLENGVSFFGKASNGGRIIMDGNNGTIYGGANGFLSTPEIGDSMWNTMRLSLVDLTHAAKPEMGGNGELYYPIRSYITKYYDNSGNEITPGSKTYTELNTFNYSSNDPGDGTRAGEDRTISANVQIQGIKQGYKKRFFGQGASGTTLSYRNPYSSETETFFISGTSNQQGTKTNAFPPWYGLIWKQGYIKAAQKPSWFLLNTRHNDLNGELKTYKKFVEYVRDCMNHQARLLGRGNPWTVDNVQFGSTRWKIQWQQVNGTDFYKDFSTSNSITYVQIYGSNPRSFSRPTLEDLMVGGVPRYHFPDCGIPANYWDAQLQYDPDSWSIFNIDSETNEPLSAFGASRASTTPAIEVGQHIHGLRPGPIPDEYYWDVMENLYIPGDRNFMVTYDGTMWAMNGVFMGNVIASNIIGGKIIGTDFKAGPLESGDVNVPRFSRVIPDREDAGAACNWAILKPRRILQNQLITVNGAAGGEPITARAGIDGKTGTVYAENAFLYGGSIDMGSFHILKANGGGTGEADYGHLIQTGESDFVGPGHFYGNVGIAPRLFAIDRGAGATDPTLQPSGNNMGNLFQTYGVVGLGIYLPLLGGKHHDLTAHKFMTGENTNMTGYSISQYYSGVPYSDSDRRTKMWGGSSGGAQSNSMFAIDTRNALTDGYEIRGHFWPLSFRILNDTQAYLQTMDLFSTGIVTIPIVYPNWSYTQVDYRGLNFFRIHPYGVDAMRLNITNQFIYESQSKGYRPSPNNQNAYLGYYGLTGNGFADSMAGDRLEAMGITTFFQVGISFWSDGNLSSVSRGSQWFAAAPKGKTHGSGTVVRPELINGGIPFLCTLQLGTSYGGTQIGRTSLNGTILHLYSLSDSNEDANICYDPGANGGGQMDGIVTESGITNGITMRQESGGGSGNSGLWLWSHTAIKMLAQPTTGAVQATPSIVFGDIGEGFKVKFYNIPPEQQQGIYARFA